METLGYYDDDTKNITLGDLEKTIAQTMAAVFWRGELLR